MKNSDIQEQDLIYLRQKANQPVPLKFWLILAAVVIVFGSIIYWQHNQIKMANIEEKAVKLDKQAEKQKQVAADKQKSIDSITKDVSIDFKAKAKKAANNIEYVNKPKSVPVTPGLVEMASDLDKYEIN